MRAQLSSMIWGIVACSVLGTGCAGTAGYSPPPERRAGERCPPGETWICRDRYPSRLPGQNEEPMICYCDAILRTR